VLSRTLTVEPHSMAEPHSGTNSYNHLRPKKVPAVTKANTRENERSLPF
jgi:hypothetical protein